jgi:hypothetical protein
MVGAEHHEKGTRSAGQVAAASCAAAPEPSAGSVASNVASCAAVRSCKPAAAALALGQRCCFVKSQQRLSAHEPTPIHHHRIHRLRAAVLHQGIFQARAPECRRSGTAPARDLPVARRRSVPPGSSAPDNQLHAPAYQKFESIPLQRRVRLSTGISPPRSRNRAFRANVRAMPGDGVGRDWYGRATGTTGD